MRNEDFPKFSNKKYTETTDQNRDEIRFKTIIGKPSGRLILTEDVLPETPGKTSE